MIRQIQTTGVLIIFLLAIFSCGSSAQQDTFEQNEAIATNDNGGDDAGMRLRSHNGRSESFNNERMIAYDASITIIVKNNNEVLAAREKVIGNISAYDGFMVRINDNRITARIPAVHMDEYLNAAKSLGKVRDERRSGTDITDQHRDNAIRLESLRNSRNRYTELLEKANNVSDILNVEKELERVNTQIEIIEGRIKHAQQSTAYSSITVNIKEQTRPGPIGWIFYGLYRAVKWLFIWD